MNTFKEALSLSVSVGGQNEGISEMQYCWLTHAASTLKVKLWFATCMHAVYSESKRFLVSGGFFEPNRIIKPCVCVQLIDAAKYILITVCADMQALYIQLNY